MEEKKLNVTMHMIIIFVLTVALGVTYYFGFVADKDEKATNTAENVTSNELVKNETSKERFDEFMKNYKKNAKDWKMSLTNVYIRNDFYITLEKGIVYFNINKDSSLYTKYGPKHKVAEDIANIYMCEVGTGSMYDLVMLGYDGSAKNIFMEVSSLEQEIKIETIENVKNAVTVRCGTDEEAFYSIVDIDGNIVL